VHHEPSAVLDPSQARPAIDAPARSRPFWVPLSVAAYWLRLPSHRVLTLIKTGRLVGRLVGARWWVSTANVRALARQRRRRWRRMTTHTRGAA